MGKYAAILAVLIGALAAQSDLANQEFRATWVVAWELINPGDSVEENQALANSILDRHVEGNMNAVLWHARRAGEAYYRSSYEPWGISAGYDDPGYDPLAYAIEQAHARGLELHAWFNVFATQSTEPGTPAIEHPTWVCRDGSGNPMPTKRALSPGLDSVRAYLVDVAMEIVNNYDIDGLHLDYVRWNEYTTTTVNYTPALGKVIGQEEFPLDGMIAPAQLEALNAAADPDRYLYDMDHPYSGGIPDSANGEPFPSWEDYWRWCVTDFVQTLHDSIQAVKPWVRLSAAVLGKYNWSSWQAYGTVYQDAALWFNEDGHIDQLMPMHYHWSSGSQFLGMLTGDVGRNWQEYIQPGIDAGRLFSSGPGSYLLESRGVWDAHEDIVTSVRTLDWVDGFQFFRAMNWTDHDYWTYAAGSFFSGKTKIRGTRLIVDVSPQTPALALNQVDPLVHDLTVAPAGGADGNQWYILYRSEDAVIDTAVDEIVRVAFGTGDVNLVQAFDGTQDYEGKYYYGATVADRYWNESSLSNLVQTETVPSYPPVVKSSYPAENDTIGVADRIVIEFSKTMLIDSVIGSITVEPSIPVQAIEWTPDRHTATVILSDSLEFDTDYTLTIAPPAQDVNGKTIDGDGDGTAGDPFVVHFRSQPADLTGPVVLTTFPNAATGQDEFRVDEVIGIQFDEPIVKSSITAESITLSRNGSAVPFSYHILNTDDAAVLSIQALDPLRINASYDFGLAADAVDIWGNKSTGEIGLGFTTAQLKYTASILLDRFDTDAAWYANPRDSGTKDGYHLTLTYFDVSSSAHLPAAPIGQRKAARLHYEWIPGASEYILRQYMNGSPADIVFDNTYKLQVHLFGDGSGNQFRFAVDDGRVKGRSDLHEVSQWIPIDWYGWRLVEWDLGDPSTFGVWIGNGQWDNPTTLYFDSFQMTHIPGQDTAGTIYFDNLRLIKEESSLAINDRGAAIPTTIALYPNYPNPFNSSTLISYYLPERATVRLTVYDLRGRLVTELGSGTYEAGLHSLTWHGLDKDGRPVASGIYLYRLISRDGYSTTRQLTLLK